MFARINLSELRPTTLAALFVDTESIYDRSLILSALKALVGEEEAMSMIDKEMEIV